MIKLKKINDELIAGLCFIGDPHVWSRKPGRRRDSSYLDTIINKIDFIAKKCNELNLWPIILGDLLHDSTDNDLVMLGKLERVLGAFKYKPIVLTGNHDLTQTKLTEGTTLHFLYSTGKINCIIESNMLGYFEIGDERGIKKVAFGGTPYGMHVPENVGKLLGVTGCAKMNGEEIKEAAGFDNIIWVTHDDFAFDKPYPGSKQITEIIGVDLSINGHMHGYQTPVQVGCTSWHNPGNINRMTIDMKDHKPRVWVWLGLEQFYETGRTGMPVIGLSPIDIPHQSGVTTFSMEGRITENVSLTNNDELADDAGKSKFVMISKSADQGDLKTDDGTLIREAILEEAEAGGDSDETIKIVSSLLDRCIEQNK